MYNVWYGGTLTSLVLRVCCITAVPPLIGMSGATCMLYYSCTSSHWHVWCYVCVVLQLYLLSLACLVLRLCCITAVPLSLACLVLRVCCITAVPHWPVSARVALMRNQLCFTWGSNVDARFQFTVCNLHTYSTLYSCAYLIKPMLSNPFKGLFLRILR